MSAHQRLAACSQLEVKWINKPQRSTEWWNVPAIINVLNKSQSGLKEEEESSFYIPTKTSWNTPIDRICVCVCVSSSWATSDLLLGSKCVQNWGGQTEENKLRHAENYMNHLNSVMCYYWVHHSKITAVSVEPWLQWGPTQRPANPSDCTMKLNLSQPILGGAVGSAWGATPDNPHLDRGSKSKGKSRNFLRCVAVFAATRLHWQKQRFNLTLVILVWHCCFSMFAWIRLLFVFGTCHRNSDVLEQPGWGRIWGVWHQTFRQIAACRRRLHGCRRTTELILQSI